MTGRLETFLAYAESHRTIVSAAAMVMIALIAWTDFMSELTMLSLCDSVLTSKRAPDTLRALDWRGRLLRRSVYRSWPVGFNLRGEEIRRLRYSGACIDFSHIPVLEL